MDTQGKRLKELRNVLRLSQVELGNVLGIAGPSITKAENDKNNFSNETLAKLAELLSVNINWLLIGKGDMFVKDSSANDDLKIKIRYEVKALLDEYGLKDVLK